MCPGFDFWGVAAGKVLVHLVGHGLCFLPQLCRQGHQLAPPGRLVEKCALRNVAHQHFFQRHGLRTELQPVGIVGFGASVLVLYGQGLPTSFNVLQRDPLRVDPKLHHVAVTAQPQPMADHLHPACEEQIAAPLALCGIVAAFVVKPPRGREMILDPLLLKIIQSPLPSAKAEMLDAGHLQVVIRIHHRLPASGRLIHRRRCRNLQ